MSAEKFISSNSNSPESLHLLCIRYIISEEKIKLGQVSLPQEICNLLLKVYRETHVNTSLDEKSCGSFISQFKSHNSRVTFANFSDLPIDDETLKNFMLEHSKTLVHLDISNCSRLTETTLKHLYETPTRVQNIEKMVRSVTVTITDTKNDYKECLCRTYDSGIITTTSSKSPNITIQENVSLMTDDYSIYKALGVFDDDFSEFHTKKLSEFNNANKWKDEIGAFVNSSEASFSTNLPRTNTSIDSCSPRLNFIPSFENFQICHTKDKVTTVEITSWQRSPLQSIIIGKTTQILPDFVEDVLSEDDQCLINKNLSLKKLVIHEWTTTDGSPYLKYIISPQMSMSLQYLDLSNCSSIGDGSLLTQLKQLKTLILYNCPKLYQSLSNICALKTLKYLDISTSNDRYGHGYKNTEKLLCCVVMSLPDLTHLDISGTNLAGTRHESIRGLESRHSRFFEYLGLYSTATEAAYRPLIPAIRVAGDANEEQILTACEVYMDRIEFLRRTLNDLFHFFRFETNFHDVNRALDVVLMAMTRHLQEKQIQIAASASLFYIVKSDEAKHNFNIRIKREIIRRLLDAMQQHRYDTTMLRNGSLTLIHFKIPHDVLFEYSRLVEILLHIVTNDDDDFIQRLGIYLLNSLACQVDGEQKTLVGDLGAITTMLSLIDGRLQRRICDEVMETAWSTMWNVTDETPVNCERFLDSNGMDYFVKCMEMFSHTPELLRNMMGLLGNVAECKSLRSRLMKREYIERFSELLWSESDGIEVSYNAAGILSHIAADGAEFWAVNISDLKRDDVLERMRIAISKWKINSKRNINYRSFEPILKLIGDNDISYEAQYWAVWALCNLTRVYCSKYCPLLIDDGGVEILGMLLNKDDRIPHHITHLTKLTLLQVQRWRECGDLNGLEESDDISLF